MNITETKLKGVYLIEPRVFGDQRGWFMETYSRKKLRAAGVPCPADFVQDNQSFSAAKGTLRGLHYQREPMAQTKLLRCTRGRILDVVADIRRGSPQYKAWISVELSEANRRQIYIPRGFAHGFITLTENVEVQYKVDNDYAPDCEGCIRYDDPELGVDWGAAAAILSPKDREAPLLKDHTDINFVYDPSDAARE